MLDYHSIVEYLLQPVPVDESEEGEGTNSTLEEVGDDGDSQPHPGHSGHAYIDHPIDKYVVLKTVVQMVREHTQVYQDSDGEDTICLID